MPEMSQVQYVIGRLYAGEQCRQDGLRFATKAELAAHESWLKQVKAVRDEAKKAGGIQSRPWYGTAEIWISEPRPSQRAIIRKVKSGKGGRKASGKDTLAVTGKDDDEEIRCVPMDDAHSTCKLCGE